MKATEQKILRFIKENELIKTGEKILLALSGGPDSVFLLHFLNKYKNKFKIKLGAAHVNHLLRGKNSDQDEQFCKAICNELEIPYFGIKKNVRAFANKNKLSIEIAARKIRYDFLGEVVRKQDYIKIVTAHNSDDNTETVLLNLIKGTGIKGISGIPVKRENIVRPALCLTKSEILDYLEENKYEYRIDESNLKNEYERNYLRNKVIPLIKENLNPSLSNTMLNSSLNLQRFNYWLEEIVKNYSNEIKSVRKKRVEISIKIFDNANKFLLSHSIKELLDDTFAIKSTSVDIAKVFSLKNKDSGSSEELSKNLIALRERNSILITRKKEFNNQPAIKAVIGKNIKLDGRLLTITPVNLDDVKIGKNKNIEYISGDNLSFEFSLRNWKKGDKFYPIGMNGTKKVSDYLNDIKINSFEKKNQLILENDGKIVWIIGRRLDDRFKVTANTKKVLKLCLN